MAVENLNPKALNDLGDACFYGINRSTNLELAYTYYKQAADMDNPVGYFNMGNYFMVKKDYKQALLNYEKARAYQYSPASITLARLYQEGDGVKKNKTKAFKYLLGAAKLNDPDAFNAVGECYNKGVGTKKDIEKAFEFFQKSADLNNATGQLNVGLYHLNHKNFAKNPENAIHWLDKAAMNGDLTAMKTLYTLYKEGKIAYFKNKSLAYLQEMAFYYLEMMAKAKDPMALKICAKTFYEGNQVTRRNYEKACSYYQTLHDMGDIEGKYGYGVCLLYGQGTKQNIELAKTLFEQCSQDKHPQALGKLGDIYRMGMKTAVDAEKAKKYYMEASRLQDLESLLNLGLLNYREQIENHSPALAYSYMETAAKKGYFQAMYWLGIFHDIGVGCTASFKEAEKWFEKAIKAGSVGSKYKYGAMILDKIEHQKINSKKKIAYYQRARKLMIEYCLDPQHSQSNHAYAMHYLGMIYKQGLGIEVSDRTARYWFEMAATTGLSKSMVEVHLYLKGKEPIPSLKWLKDALKDTQCSEALYEMGNLYLEGYGSLIESDIKQAKFYYEQAARLNHPQALEKLMMN